MKQKVTVRAYIKQDEKILLIRRASGNEALLGKFELPGGKLEYGEQPVDALKREIKEELGADTETVQLYDVVSYMSSKIDNAQHITIVYRVSLAPQSQTIFLSADHDRYVWKKLSDIQLDEVTESVQLILGLTPDFHPSESSDIGFYQYDGKNATYDQVIIYSDGGSRGNPGPSAAGYVVMDKYETVIHEGGKYLGITTNNQAEYQAVRLALEKARELGAHVIDFRMDSMLVVNQLSGIYQVKNRELWPIHREIKELVASFEKVSFRHVRREFNQLADGMVNKILDEQAVA